MPYRLLCLRVLQNNKALKPQIRLKTARCRMVILFYFNLLYHKSEKFSTISHKSSVMIIALSSAKRERFF